MTRRGVIAFFAILGLTVGVRVFHVADWVVWIFFFIGLFIAILDYYWLGGRLSGRSYSNGKK